VDQIVHLAQSIEQAFENKISAALSSST